MTEDLWRLKVTAFLHDPPQKALLLGRGIGHEAVARGLVAAALGVGVGEHLWQRAKEADRVASAADRIDFPAEAQACWWRRPVLRHPLSGKEHDLGSLAALDVDAVNARVQQTVEAIRVECQGDPKTVFLRLWRGLVERLKAGEEDGEPLGALWDLLPADTRLPQHTIWDHNRIVSALAGALPEPALLVASIGPVQDFIASARKTQDLWAGSWILSYLAWQGMKAIAARWGPDAVLFPALRGQPLVDLWLGTDQGVPGVGEPDFRHLETPSLPNRWVALVPADEAEDAGKAASAAVRDGWLDLAGATRRVLGERSVEIEEAQWTRQHDWVEVYWTAHRWPVVGEGVPSDLKAALDAALGPDAAFDRLLDAFERSGKYQPNLGTFYGRLHTLADRAHGSRKTLRGFAGGPGEPGYKCTLCGEREPACDASVDTSDHGRLVAAWCNLGEKLGAAVAEAEGRERLCTVCLTKRLVPAVMHDILHRTGGVERARSQPARFPSTSEVAATTFKRFVLERTREDGSLRRALAGFLDAVPERGPHLGACAPATLRAARRLADDTGDERWRKFVALDGEWLFPETYESEEAERRLGAAKRPMLGRLRALVSEAGAAGIADPTPYYAVLFLDGDLMGQWVSGTHERFPAIEASLHPDAVASCREAFGRDLLGQRRPQSPSLQGALSGALLGFGLRIARHVVEAEHSGKLVYAGGDDVFALAPLDGVLALAGALEAAFREPALIAGDRVLRGAEALAAVRGRRRLERDGAVIHLGMGEGASASAGIAVAHHRQPLGQVLEAARRMEQRAKRVLGPAAFSVAVLRRSGEESEAGAKWRLGDLPATVDLVEELAALFGDRDGLSPRVLGDLRREQAGLAALPPEAWERRLAYLLRRHAGETRRAQAEGLAPALRVLAERFREREAGWREAVELVGLAAFLARHAGARRDA